MKYWHYVHLFQWDFYALLYYKKLGTLIVGLSGRRSDDYPIDYWLTNSGILQEIDIVGVPLGISMGRANAMEYTAPVQVEVHSVVYPYPTYGSDMTGFLKPFSVSVRIFI